MGKIFVNLLDDSVKDNIRRACQDTEAEVRRAITEKLIYKICVKTPP